VLIQISQKPYDNTVEYFLHTANFAVLSLIYSLIDNIPERDLATGQFDLWKLWEFVHLRHLHLFFKEFVTSSVLSEDFFTLDTSAFNLENVHIDDQFNVCAIIDWDGLTVKPAHLAIQLPRPLDLVGSYWSTSSISQVTTLQCVAFKNAFERPIHKSLLQSKLLKCSPTEAMDLSNLWSSFSRAKDFERTMYFFNGTQSKESIEWRAYTDFTDSKFIEAFGRNPDMDESRTKDLLTILLQKWAVMEKLYEIPSIPRPIISETLILAV
jgi:hypothetical protein